MATLAELCVAEPPIGAGYELDAGARLVVRIAVPITTAEAARWGSATWATSEWSFGAGVWGSSHWGTDGWSNGLEWLEVADRLRGASWTRGSGELSERPEVGTATLTFANADGYLSWWNANSTFPSRSHLSRGTLVQLGYWDDATWTPAFTGVIETIEEASSDTTDADLWATFGLVETISELAAIDRPEQAPVGAGDFWTDRFGRLLEDAQWRYGTDLDDISGVFIDATYQPTTMAGNRLTEVYLTADSIFADAYTGRDGSLTLSTKAGPIDSIATVIGERTGAATISGFPRTMVAWTEPPRLRESADQVVNRVTAARAGGSAVTEVDEASIARNGEQSTQRLDLIINEDDLVAFWAGLAIDSWADASHEISEVHVSSTVDPAALVLITELDVSSAITVARHWARYPDLPVMLFFTRVLGYTIDVVALGTDFAEVRAALRLAIFSYRQEI